MIYKYEILNPIPIITKPHLNRRDELVIPSISKANYKWYIIGAQYNPTTNDREYYILFSNIKFDYNCIKLTKDYGRRYAITINGEFADYVYREINSRGNVNIDYLCSEDDFDVYIVK